MNKSLALKNKLSLYFLFIISFFVVIYLCYFLINGDRGLISYYKIKTQNIAYKVLQEDLNKKNYLLNDRIKRLQLNTIDLDFLDEKIRENIGFVDKDELLVLFN